MPERVQIFGWLLGHASGVFPATREQHHKKIIFCSVLSGNSAQNTTCGARPMAASAHAAKLDVVKTQQVVKQVQQFVPGGHYIKQMKTTSEPCQFFYFGKNASNKSQFIYKS